MILEIKEKLRSNDGSIKYVFQTASQQLIEAIYFRLPNRSDFPDDIYHMCISSQAGCAMGCTFCATGYGGFFSQLSSDEMLAQVDFIIDDLTTNKIEPSSTKFSVGLMGMGEPLMNYESVEAFCYSAAKKYTNIEAICISTVGISPKIEKLADLAIEINILRLFVSIHSPYDQERASIMPINNKYSIQSVLDSCRAYYKKTRSKITLSYLLLRDVNDSKKHAEDLAKCIHSDHESFVIQILLYNETPGIPFTRPADESALMFGEVLISLGFETIVQVSKGQDIDGGCGQLIKKINIKALEKRKSQTKLNVL